MRPPAGGAYLRTAAGVKVTLDDYPGMVHDFIYLQAVLPQAAEALRAAGSALKTALQD